ncbi:peptidase inhibitor I78 family protein [Kushneria sinocarnis]|uniref:Peptidase inhibitor I78 family protein n=1 Tax=Kushneria sinocarnis TaxID=595502 RepID=A0A420WU22_9GAMM|nr:I78 family peptidase inhibitor [Kushneria sinocarnis]RKQ96937.1 peptidase inhibitor I78 family protein [Kushneria sinocarnis]
MAGDAAGIGNAARSRILVLGMMTLLTGCSWFGGGNDRSQQTGDAARQGAPVPAGTLPQQADPTTCGADRLEELAGRSLEPGVRQQIVDRSGAEQYRVVGPHTMVTMDFNPQRLDIRVDDNQQISGFDCG